MPLSEPAADACKIDTSCHSLMSQGYRHTVVFLSFVVFLVLYLVMAV